MSELEKEAIDKAIKFHDLIESDESLHEVLMGCDEWHKFRSVMISLSL